MPTAEPQVNAARLQLNRVLASEGFCRNERLSRFLRFVVEQHLEGKDDQIKESVIALEVFGRGTDHDPKQNSIVRNEAARLRARLNEYYLRDGKNDDWVIELPKGGYAPLFRQVTERPVAIMPAPENGSTNRAKRVWLVMAVAGAAVVLATLAWWWSHHGATPISIAVLPLENVSHDASNDYFADGLTDELIRKLSIIDGLAVRSRTSSFAIKGRSRNIRDAGQQLNADYILEGSVLRAGQQLRINVQLVRVRDDFPLWAAGYDEELTDVFAIQDKISRGIVNNLRLNLGHGRRRYETSIEAYDLYLHARAQPQRNVADARIAAGLYRQVIAKDGSFAPAYAGLSAAYAAISFQGFRDHTDELTQMRIVAEDAMRLDPLLSEAHQALGMIYSRDAQWTQAEKSFRRAIELDPSNSLAYCDMTSNVLLALGRTEEAVREMQLAEKTDPLSPWVQNVLALAQLSTGRYNEAAEHCQKAGEARCLGRARLEQGRIEEAIKLLATDNPNPQYLGYAYGRAGRREEAERFAVAAAPNAFTQALTFAGLGDKDRTLEALDRLASNGAVRVGRALNSPEFAFLRGDSRVRALRKKVGLPE